LLRELCVKIPVFFANHFLLSIILTGRLNGDDINFIRQMAGGSQFDGFTNGKLINLDIGNAMIVQGGSYINGGEYYTSSLEIGQSMFALLNLHTIILPKTTKIISSGAFYQCEKLLSITIPDNVFSIKLRGSACGRR
jgi:hypothetical protein